jgi:4-diphosphocytidyl-2-C-methyl-D-erythritol kinase
LGGGSADAAAALVGIDAAWGLGLGLETLRRLGAGLGSDVPFFIDEERPARPAIVGGFGEEIERVGRAAGEVLLVMPPFGCPTGAVYGAFDRGVGEIGLSHAVRDGRVRETARAARVGGEDLFNDLAAAACRVRPELGEVRGAVERALGRPVHVTGSGSSLFVVCGPGEGERLAGAVAGAVDGAWGHAAVRVCRLV